jgi:hypothetical protein
MDLRDKDFPSKIPQSGESADAMEAEAAHMDAVETAILEKSSIELDSCCWAKTALALRVLLLVFIAKTEGDVKASAEADRHRRTAVVAFIILCI